MSIFIKSLTAAVALTLLGASPAWALSFKAIPMNDIGVTEDNVRTWIPPLPEDKSKPLTTR